MCCVAFCRAGSAQPVAYDTPYDDDEDQPGSEGSYERHQQGGEARGVQPKGPGGLMGHMYNRKLEQAQQVIATHCNLFALFCRLFLVYFNTSNVC